MILKWVCAVVWDFVNIRNLQEKFEQLSVFVMPKRKRLFALNRIFIC